MDCRTRIKLLIVDDEYDVREGLKLTIDWKSNDIEVVGLAQNGNEAVKLIDEHKPDVVLTDVRMPGMDGIALAKWICENHANIKVIFLSAYSDFEYAQKAMKHGVVEYLLKPIDIDNLFEIIDSIRDDVIKKNVEKYEFERLKSILEKNMPVLREKYIRDVLNGKYQSDIQELFKLYEIDLKGDSYLVAIIAIEGSSTRADMPENQINSHDERCERLPCTDKNINFEILKLELADLVNSIIKDPYKAYLFNENIESIGIAFSVNSKFEKPYLFRGVTGAMEKIREFFLEKGVTLTVGISDLYNDVKMLKNCYYEAIKALKARVYVGSGKVIEYSNLEKGSKFSMESNEADKIYEYMKNYDWLNVQLSIKRYFEHYSKNHGMLEKHSQFIIYELIAILKRVLANNQESSGISIRNEEIDELLRFSTLQDMCDGIIDLFIKYFNLMIEQRDGSSNAVVRKIIEYIGKNYMNEINLKEIAKTVYLHQFSLSRLFLKETGVPFSEYIIRYRIEKAKELLISSDLKVYEISDKVGYQSEKYFINLFKKIVGVSPAEFKKNNKSNNTKILNF